MPRQFMRETNRLKAPLKPIRTSFMIQMRQELGSYTLGTAAERSASPAISTHANTRGIYHWQEHILATLMALRARVTEPALLIVDTLRADPGRWFATFPTRDQRRGIAGEHLDRQAFRFTVFFCEHFQAQFRGGAEIILVEKRESWTEHFVQPHPHLFLTHLPIRKHACARRIALLADLKGTQVSTTLQPDLSEELIKIGEGRTRADFEMHPVHGQTASFPHHMQFLGFAPRFVL